MKEFFLASTFLGIFLLPTHSWAQEEKEMPSQKTKEAIEKFKKAQAIPGKALDSLREAGKATLQGALGTQAAEKAKNDPLALPPKVAGQSELPPYSSVGKRDPFRPLTMRSKASARPRENLSPLERFELGQLKLVAIVWDIKEPRAMVEDASGLGYVVKVGTPVGPNEGKVKAIKPTEVIIEESYIDFFGARKNQEVSMKLPED
jgi:type IV pilus assembly protein PilP